MEIDDGAPTAEDMQRVFDTSRSLQWNTVARKIAERTVSSGAEGGLDSLFSSLSKSGFLHVTLVLKKAKKNGTWQSAHVRCSPRSALKG